MIKYARQDTHYLLYIYDCLKNDLIKNGNETKNLLRSAFERSRLICLKVCFFMHFINVFIVYHIIKLYFSDLGLKKLIKCTVLE